jgi:hypothetical protein
MNSISKHTSRLVLFAFLLTGPSWAADNGMVGKWKLDLSKSKVIDLMKVDSAGADKYAFDFGGGSAETIVPDGTDQPGISGTTLCVSIEDPHTWKVVRKKEGRMLLTATWNLSEDGKTLTDHYTEFQPNGSPFKVDYVYQRTAGSSGFVGSWESASQQVNSAFELEVRPFETGGPSFSIPAEGVTKNIDFDGKDYPNLGANVSPGSTSSGRRVSDSTVEVTDKMHGKVTKTQQVTISPDHKSLIVTVHPVGQSQPNILVFDRE